jgi:hypothetical protein
MAAMIVGAIEDTAHAHLAEGDLLGLPAPSHWTISAPPVEFANHAGRRCFQQTRSKMANLSTQTWRPAYGGLFMWRYCHSQLCSDD